MENKKQKSNRFQDDYDSPWKEILEKYFPQFIEFFFPEAYKDINWNKGYEFLDKELQQITKKAKTGRKIEVTSDLLTSRGGLTLFCRYLEMIGILDILQNTFGNIRKSSKGLPIVSLFKQIFSYL